jgi:precorrin-3B synthase
MPAADGLLVRVRPRLQRLTSGDARLIAAAARQFGNGTIELTNRGNLQLRGLNAASAAGCAALIGHLDQAERRPGLLCAPLLGLDPAGHRDAEALAWQLAEVLAAVPALSGRAEKVLVALDDGGRVGLGDPAADIAVRADGDAWLLQRDGEAAPVRVATSAVPDRVRVWLDEWRAAGVARMRDMGPAGVGAVGGSVPGVGTEAPPSGYVASVGAFGVGIAFGAMDSARLERLADDAARHGDGGLRLSARRVVWLTGVSPDSALLIDPGDRAASACIGRAGCAAASTDTRADAAALARFGVTHVSGCAKGCAHPGAAAITLVGVNGLYDVVRDGRAWDAPVRRALTVGEVAAYLAGSTS